MLSYSLLLNTTKRVMSEKPFRDTVLFPTLKMVVSSRFQVSTQKVVCFTKGSHAPSASISSTWVQGGLQLSGTKNTEICLVVWFPSQKSWSRFIIQYLGHGAYQSKSVLFEHLGFVYEA